MSNTVPKLGISELTKRYGNSILAVEDISVDIAAGEFVSFLGPSGSGKTTTLMMVAGFEHPSSGAIRIDGTNVVDIPSHKRNIGVVFQNYALFPHLTVEENIAFPLRMRKVADAVIRREVAAAIELVNLDQQFGRYPRQLSGGQQQRVALARAIVFKPSLILLDEPLGALDKALREHMQRELKRIHRELGVTMVYVTHDQTEAMTMSDRIVVFDRGQIEQADTPANVYFRPKTRFVAGFVGESNIYTARVSASDRVEVEGLGQLGCSAGANSLGATVEVMLRPENVSVKPAIAGDKGWRGVVTEVVDYGDSLLIAGRINGQSIVSRSRREDGLAAIKPSQEVSYGWDDRHIHIIGT